MLAYFLDMAEKSGVIGVVQPDRTATEKMPMLISFLVMGKGIDSSVGIGFSLLDGSKFILANIKVLLMSGTAHN